MAQEIIMPKLGLTMTHGMITKWLKKEGDMVKSGDAVVEIETDKIIAEVESPLDGYLLKILAEEGEEKEITVPICIVGEKYELAETKKEETVETKKVELVQVIENNSSCRIFITPIAKKLSIENKLDYKSINGTGPLGRIVKADILKALSCENPESGVDTDFARIKATPLARKIASENDIDYKVIKGTGPTGRIVKNDILSAIEKKENHGTVPSHSKVTTMPEVRKTAEQLDGIAISKRIPLSGIRRVIASRLSQSKHEIPHVYFKTTIDASNMIELKNKLSPAVKAKTGKKLSINDLIIKATAVALSEFPDVNVSLVNDEIIYYEDVNVGMAVSIEKGLVVPVIKNADIKSLAAIGKTAGELADKARCGKLLPDDMTGGTITISNLGAYGIEEFSAIINPPESAILAVGVAKETPCVENGLIVVRYTMVLTLSVDHRVIDGVLAAQFIKRLKELLENPYSMLI